MLRIILLVLKYCSLFYGFAALLAAGVAVFQEAKIWKPKTLPSLSVTGMLKVFLFNVVWMFGCFLGSLLIVIKAMVSLGYSDIPKDGQFVEAITASLVIHLFIGQVEVVGQDNLPSETKVPAPVFVANHASQIDVAVAYKLERRFRWAAKKSVVYVPGVGPLMLLANHIMIDRKRKNGRSSFYPKANNSVQMGLPLFIFPQGTRRIAERLPAKNGAFVVAQENSTTLVPLSIEIPITAWNSLYPFGPPSIVRYTIHKCIQASEKGDIEQLKLQCMDQIYSALPEHKGKDE